MTVRDAVARGTIGPLHAIELVLYNAYGPDEPWFQAFRVRCDAAILRNVGGSCYDFGAELRRGTTARRIADGPDARGGRAAVQSARRLAAGERYDLRSRRLVTVPEVIDRIYAR